MGILDETRSIERLRFFDGQRLFASDLQGIEAFNREMRWLHNQSLHQPGIGKGFAVTGRRGDREVRIGPGYALDDLGREIVLTTGRTEPVPPVDSERDGGSVFFDLTVAYPADATLAEAETRQGICLPRGVVRLREEPLFCWVRLEAGEDRTLHAVDTRLRDDVEQSRRIVLARVEVFQCKLKQPVSIAERKSARPATQPYIACGHDAVIWSEWKPEEPPRRRSPSWRRRRRGRCSSGSRPTSTPPPAISRPCPATRRGSTAIGRWPSGRAAAWPTW